MSRRQPGVGESGIGDAASAVPATSVAVAAQSPSELDSVLRDISLMQEEGTLTAQDVRRITDYGQRVDISDLETVMQYGVGAQARLAGLSEAILRSIGGRDDRGAGALVSQAVEKIRSFDPLKPTGLRGLFGGGNPDPAVLRKKYDSVAREMDALAVALQRSAVSLMKEAALLEKLAQENAACERELICFIQAGRYAVAKRVDEAALASESGSLASREGRRDALAADERGAIERFERKLHDLSISHAMSLQMKAQILLVRDSIVSMAQRAQFTVRHAIPLWKSRMVLALGLADAQAAARAHADIAEAEAGLLEDRVRDIRELVEQAERECARGTASTEAVRRINEQLAESLTTVMRIEAQAESRRTDAAKVLGRRDGTFVQ